MKQPQIASYPLFFCSLYTAALAQQGAASMHGSCLERIEASGRVHLIEEYDHGHGQRRLEVGLHYQPEHVQANSGLLPTHRGHAPPLIAAGGPGSASEHVEATASVRALHIVPAARRIPSTVQ